MPLLNYSKPNKYNFKPVDVNDILKETIETQYDLFPKIRFCKQLNHNLPKIIADEPSLREIFINLITNSSQAMPEGGRIMITTNYIKQNQVVEINFEDTGPGIQRENIEKIFDPFFTTKSKGVGLGLAIVQRIVECHKGDICVESKVKKGTKFSIKLPIQLPIQ